MFPHASQCGSQTRWSKTIGYLLSGAGHDAEGAGQSAMTAADPDAIGPDGTVRLRCYLPMVRRAASMAVFSAATESWNGWRGQTVTQHEDTVGFFV